MTNVPSATTYAWWAIFALAAVGALIGFLISWSKRGTASIFDADQAKKEVNAALGGGIVGAIVGLVYMLATAHKHLHANVIKVAQREISNPAA